MQSWIAANISTIIISIALIAVIASILTHIVRRKKQGKSSCGCGCGSCAMKESCQTKR